MLNEIVKRALANKIAKGFPIKLSTDIANMHGELEELRAATNLEDQGQEIADIIIYCCGIAGYLGLDLEGEILKKMARVEKRIITVKDGKFFKEEGK